MWIAPGLCLKTAGKERRHMYFGVVAHIWPSYRRDRVYVSYPWIVCEFKGMSPINRPSTTTDSFRLV